jgi:hypothetical protein
VNFSTKVIFSLGYMRKSCWLLRCAWFKQKKKTHKSTQHRFKFLPHREYLVRSRHYIEQEGTNARRYRLSMILSMNAWRSSRRSFRNYIFMFDDKNMKQNIYYKFLEY